MLLERAWIGIGIAVIASCTAACKVNVNEGGTGDEMAACFVLCANDDATCESHPGLDHNDCGAIGEAECNGEPQEQKLITGCECPFDGAPEECTAADGVPDWI
jgi:hypothetical protein